MTIELKSTNEVIKELAEHPEKRFRAVEINSQVAIIANKVIWTDTGEPLEINKKTLHFTWVEEARSYDFLKALKESKHLKVHHHFIHEKIEELEREGKIEEAEFLADTLNGFIDFKKLLRTLNRFFTDAKAAHIILEGKFYPLSEAKLSPIEKLRIEQE